MKLTSSLSRSRVPRSSPLASLSRSRVPRSSPLASLSRSFAALTPRLLFACIVAFGLGICLPPLAATTGLGVIILSAIVSEHLAAAPQTPSLPLEGRPKAAQPASGGGEP